MVTRKRTTIRRGSEKEGNVYRVRSTRAVGAILLALSIALVPAFAQTTEKDAAFRALLNDPDDPDLMLRYARLAIAERDYEAALATLERLIDLDPTSQEARFELAVAYFALGVDDVAQYHLDIYTERGQLTAAEESRARRYESALASRLEALSISGSAEAGLVYRADSGDVGASGTLAFNIRQDMGGALATSWLTSARIFGLKFPEASEDDSVRFVIRSGPSFGIDGTALGTRIQPFLSLDVVEDRGGADSGVSFGGGVLYTKPVNENWSIFLDAEAGLIDRPSDGIDSTYVFIDTGASLQATQSTALRFTLRVQQEDAEAGGIDSDRLEGGLSVFHETNLPLFGTEYGSSISGFARYARDSFSDGVKDDVISLGANFRTYFSANVYLDAGIQRFTRSSSDPTFNDEDTIVAISAGWEF